MKLNDLFYYEKSNQGHYRKLTRMHISVDGVKLWNDASINLKMCNSLLVFKRLICKDFLNVTDALNFQYIQILFVMLEGDVFLLFLLTIMM